MSNDLHEMLLQRSSLPFGRPGKQSFAIRLSDFIDGCNDSSQIADKFCRGIGKCMY